MKSWLGIFVLMLTFGYSANAKTAFEANQNSLSGAFERIVDNTVPANSFNTEETLPLFRISVLSLKQTLNGIQLNWMVEETANLQYFLIEHSADGQSFLPLFEMPVQLNQRTYSFTDARIKAGDKKVYYRVKAVYPTVVIESPIQKL